MKAMNAVEKEKEKERKNAESRFYLGGTVHTLMILNLQMNSSSSLFCEGSPQGWITNAEAPGHKLLALVYYLPLAAIHPAGLLCFHYFHSQFKTTPTHI